VEDTGDGFQVPNDETITDGIDDYTFMGLDFSDPNVAVPTTVTGAGVTYWMWNKSEGARNHIKTMLNTADEAKIMNFVRDGDMLDDMLKIDKLSEQMKVAQQKLSRGAKGIHSYHITQMKDKLTSLEKAFAEKYRLKHNFTNKDMLKLIKSKDKWNIWKLKSAIMPVLRETKWTANDAWKLIRSKGLGQGKNSIGMRAFWLLAPFEGGMKLAEKLGADGIVPQLATGAGTVFITNQFRKAAANKYKDVTVDAINQRLKSNPKLKSKIGEYLTKLGLKYTVKTTVKGGAGAVLSTLGPKIPAAGVPGLITKGVVSGLGWLMLADSAKDLYQVGKIIKDYATDSPELYQILFEEAEPDSMELSPELDIRGNEALQKIYGTSIISQYQNNFYGSPSEKMFVEDYSKNIKGIKRRSNVETNEMYKFFNEHNLNGKQLASLHESAKVGYSLDNYNQKLELLQNRDDYSEEDFQLLWEKLDRDFKERKTSKDYTLDYNRINEKQTFEVEKELKNYLSELQEEYSIHIDDFSESLKTISEVPDEEFNVDEFLASLKSESELKSEEEEALVDLQTEEFERSKGYLYNKVKNVTSNYKLELRDERRKTHDEIYVKIKDTLNDYFPNDAQENLIRQYIKYSGIPNILPGDDKKTIENKTKNAKKNENPSRADKILKKIGKEGKGNPIRRRY